MRIYSDKAGEDMDLPEEFFDDSVTSIYNHLEIGLLAIEKKTGTILYADRNLCDDACMLPSEVLGRPYRDMFWSAFYPVLNTLTGQCEDGRTHTDVCYWPHKKQWRQFTARQAKWANGEVVILFSSTNITYTVHTRCENRRLGYNDGLLGLPNELRLQKDIDSMTDVQSVSILYFEIERISEINDFYGWEVGDHLLHAVRDWLLKNEPRSARIYRVGSGFAVLDCRAQGTDAQSWAEQILARFKEPWMMPAVDADFSIVCQIRLGIAQGKYTKSKMKNLIFRAIRAARNGEGYVIYDDKADRQAKKTIQRREQLIGCILNDMAGFYVVYQPIVEAKTRRWAGLEALCRWTDPAGQEVPPTQFIPEAEQMGLIGRLDNWVCRTAIQDCVDLALGDKDFFLDINFSPKQKTDDKTFDTLLALLRTSGFPPEKLNLEIIESERLQFSEQNLRGLEKLKDAGVALGLDDFGTAYSSLENLLELNASVLKTDKTFIHGLDKDMRRQNLLRAMVEMAHKFEMRLIAEGVETENQMQLLEEMEADLIQGYLFSKPLSFQQLKDEAWRFSI